LRGGGEKAKTAACFARFAFVLQGTRAARPAGVVPRSAEGRLRPCAALRCGFIALPVFAVPSTLSLPSLARCVGQDVGAARPHEGPRCKPRVGTGPGAECIHGAPRCCAAQPGAVSRRARPERWPRRSSAFCCVHSALRMHVQGARCVAPAGRGLRMRLQHAPCTRTHRACCTLHERRQGCAPQAAGADKRASAAQRFRLSAEPVPSTAVLRVRSCWAAAARCGCILLAALHGRGLVLVPQPRQRQPQTVACCCAPARPARVPRSRAAAAASTRTRWAGCPLTTCTRKHPSPTHQHPYPVPLPKRHMHMHAGSPLQRSRARTGAALHGTPAHTHAPHPRRAPVPGLLAAAP
jgi:hypothetical protein